MKEIKISEGVVLVEPEKVDQARLDQIREMVYPVAKAMFKVQEEERRRLPGPEFYEPLK